MKTSRYFKEETKPKTEGKDSFKKPFKKKLKKQLKKPIKPEILKKQKLPVKTEKPAIPQQKLEKYTRGRKVDTKGIQTKFFRSKFKHDEDKVKFTIEQSARAEILLNEEEGYLVADDGDVTTEYTQGEIAKNVDLVSASKHFKLVLDQFGPYEIDYTRNGRHLLMGGKKGHVAAFEWNSKKLLCEFNAMEEIFDVKWLHVETMFAVAQKKWVHFYDNKGTEVHCVKQMGNVTQLDFLPYHFLLVAGNYHGYLRWLDVSIGEIVAQYKTKDDKITIMKQNPSNAVTCVANSKGAVSMYTPSMRDPVAQILCHQTPITALAFHPKGDLMVTSGIDKFVKVWDTRKLKQPITEYKIQTVTNHIDVSQRSTLAVGMGNVCEVFKSTRTGNLSSISSYLHYYENSVITDLQFVPFEDILGIGAGKGFSSILVPGAGEANFDALEVNPFRTKSQRREHEVHSLLEKIPNEMITLDPNDILGVDTKTLKQKIENREKIPMPGQVKIKTTSKRKVSGVKFNKIKKKVTEINNQQLLKAKRTEEMEEQLKDKLKGKSKKKSLEPGPGHVLDRFISKKKK